MDKNISNIKERVLEIASFKGVSYEKFCESIGMTYGSFKGSQKNTSLNSDAIDKIISIHKDVNLEWLITGNGSMIISNNLNETSEYLHEPASEYGKMKGIPLVYGSAVGGFGGSTFQLENKDVKEYYVVPKFKNKQIDFMIEVEGSSMYPKYNSGDVVACRIINESNFIQWNKTHVVATKDQGILIKRIKPSKLDNVVTMLSDNKDYDPFDVSMDEISGLAIVIGVIRLE